MQSHLYYMRFSQIRQVLAEANAKEILDIRGYKNLVIFHIINFKNTETKLLFKYIAML